MENEWEQRRAEQERRWEQMQQRRGSPYGYQGRRGYGGYPAYGPAYGYGGYPAAPPSPYGYGRGGDNYPGYQAPEAPAAIPDEVGGQAGGGQSQ